jgi:hypothetical protein
MTRRRDSRGFATGDGVILFVVLSLAAMALGWPLYASHGATRLWAEAGWLVFLLLLLGLLLGLAAHWGGFRWRTAPASGGKEEDQDPEEAPMRGRWP